MNYEYCGMVFASELVFPFFKISYAEPNYYILKGAKKITSIKTSAIFFDGIYYIINFGEKGHYQISETIIICNFDDIKFVRATICNMPMAIIMILNNMLPIHCSSIVSKTRGGVVLFAGPKGTGKTTLAYYMNKYLDYDVFGNNGSPVRCCMA